MNSSAYERAVYTVRYCLASLIKNSAKRHDYCIENFRDKMDEYSCVNLKTSYIFSCAKDIAEWIIDLLIS